jgi:predicted GNAT family N-acyltransferase
MRMAEVSEITVVRVPGSSALGRAAFELRHKVFVVEQSVPEHLEIDEDDQAATHFVAIFEGEIVGTLRVVFKPEHAKICRVAVCRDHRGKGIAQKMMVSAINYCRARGVERFYVAAQADKTEFYEKFGFATFGSKFMDAGIPHMAMKNY